MEQMPDNPVEWLAQAEQDLSAIQRERADVDRRHDNLMADILQVRYELARLALEGGKS